MLTSSTGERIKYVGEVPDEEELAKDPKVRTINGKGRTLMSGLGDAHVHFSWNNGDLGRLGELGTEEHVSSGVNRVPILSVRLLYSTTLDSPHR
jgi:cytosine/adenosine deaminase-related metal-dependent hydrolase